MLEYGNGVGEVAGGATGGSGSGSAPVDMGGQLSQFVTDSANTILTMPPGMLLLWLVVIVLGLTMLKRVF